MAEDLRLAAGGLDEAEKHFDGGAFASAVGAEETKDFAATDLERKTTNRHLGAELFAKADGFDGQVIGRRQRVLRFRQCGPQWLKPFSSAMGTARLKPCPPAPVERLVLALDEKQEGFLATKTSFGMTRD